MFSFGYFVCVVFLLCFFKQKTAYEMRISDWSSDVCSSDLQQRQLLPIPIRRHRKNHLIVGMSDLLPDRMQMEPGQIGVVLRRAGGPQQRALIEQIGRASCRERVCQYV